MDVTGAHIAASLIGWVISNSYAMSSCFPTQALDNRPGTRLGKWNEQGSARGIFFFSLGGISDDWLQQASGLRLFYRSLPPSLSFARYPCSRGTGVVAGQGLSPSLVPPRRAYLYNGGNTVELGHSSRRVLLG
jgi:hypothetical protein